MTKRQKTKLIMVRDTGTILELEKLFRRAAQALSKHSIQREKVLSV